MFWNFKLFIPYFLAWILFFMQLFLKVLSGIANSVDPDQSAPKVLKEQSDLGRHYLLIPFRQNQKLLCKIF